MAPQVVAFAASGQANLTERPWIFAPHGAKIGFITSALAATPP
jgi:hypothetical protein